MDAGVRRANTQIAKAHRFGGSCGAKSTPMTPERSGVGWYVRLDWQARRGKKNVAQVQASWANGYGAII